MSVRSYPSLDAFFIRALNGSRIIYDHGCGYGAWTNYIASMINARVAIFDPDIKAFEYTKNLLDENGGRFIELSGGYDAIICFAVLELLSEDDQLELLNKFKGMLNHRGRLIIQYNLYNRCGVSSYLR